MLHSINSQRHVGYNPLKSCIFILQVLDPTEFIHIHASVFGFSVVERLVGNAVFPADVAYLLTVLMLLEYGYDL